MSDQSGRGYLPPTVPTSGSHLRPWSTSMLQPPYFGAQNWHSQIKPYMAIGSNSPQSEGIDLSSRPEPAHNGEPLNGQIKESTAGVSVIAPNPLIQQDEVKEDSASPIGSKAPFERVLSVDYLSNDNKMPAYPLEYKGHPAHPLLPNKGLEVGIPSPVESKDIPAESKGTPSHPVESKVPLQETLPDPETQKTPSAIPQPPDSAKTTVEPEAKDVCQPPEADHVESLLENMFQGEETPVKQSVIVKNSTKVPALTEDKVVAILEDKNEPVTSLKAKLPPSSETSTNLISTTNTAEESPSTLLTADEVKQEKTGPDIKNQFMEVESELEKMFAGIVESADESKLPSKPEMKKKAGRPTKPRQRKSTDSVGEKKEKKRKNKKVDEGRDSKVKKAKHVKITKEGSNDSMTVLSKSRGPYIHIEGTKEAPTYVGVVNSWGREEEERERGSDKTGGRRKPHSFAEGRIKGSGLYVSTLSAKYNSQSADLTWVCIFCKLRSHCENGLGGEPSGDLYGPYILTIPKAEDLDRKVPSDKEVAAEQKKKGGGIQQSLRAVGTADLFVKEFTKKNKKNNSLIEDLSGEREVWVHEMCAVWAPGVLLVGPHLIGLGDAIASASVSKCTRCGEYGACIGCVVRNCSGRSHYGCALAANWDLDFDNFIATCPVHTQKRLKLLGVRSA
ncbi:uncharacterized protein CG5098 [Cimex lectularius]|uniref:PHD-type domain-containing protein n=1 Tax=Cimex lectularius TaxID=79782 RepID=A0A8I6SV38_CIMLE|nr:uncharacterized protein CG5098 [Cimex lectularius]XP_024085449.1 uncharacterized protein CG5098 [Cimex lectularius]